MDDVTKLAHELDPHARCAPVRMWEVERTSVSPAVMVMFPDNEGEHNADALVEECTRRGWVTRRESYNRVYVDPDPGYRTHEDLTKKPSASF